ncbi:MAG TPA: amylo-alpha-1,6-glucosidase [Candidatus Mediterraneibacter surreyensis]|nr:amylo-alpha-1,6-glucosidase [Candidatus Mediterraneibacter surreyensis]
MKWIYGKQDWKTFERGQENCYLMTNGLGGYSSLTMMGSAARNDHAFLMACTKAPNNRYNMIHRLAERLEIKQETYTLSSQEFSDRSCEYGCRYLAEFSYEDTPVWRFLINGVEIEKEAALKQGENTAVVCYRVTNRSRSDACLTVTPFYQFAPKGDGEKLNGTFRCLAGRVENGQMRLYYMTNGKETEIPETVEQYYYSYDACDGRESTGKAAACHQISLDVESGGSSTLAVVFSVERDFTEEQARSAVDVAGSVIQEMKEERKKLERQSGLRGETARFLAKSAHQFVSRRESTGGKTILAGFPFFEDWGRDTMIALPGVCLSTRQYEDARSILRTFARYERQGLMPNLFPEGKSEPRYNTADAALLFINCVWLYYRASADAAFIEEMYPVMERIIASYQDGTDYEIHMDDDCLIAAGSGLDQVTWMDVRVNDILPTPRHGKPVEINAYWYNALRIMGECARLLQKDPSAYERIAEKVKEAFAEKFWMEEHHCLKDVISGTSADKQIRCNQIWAVSMPFTMLDAEKESQVVDTVFEKLYTSYGLRTLDKDDPEFQPVYGGEVLKRDLAYHQGTVWTYPLGAYYLAYLKVNGYSDAAKAYVRRQMEVLESALREGCIGQLPEIYDGEDPVSSKGCFAQAWSTGELLRVYEALERGESFR